MDPEVQAKLRRGRELFLQREAGAIAVQLSAFVDHADELRIPIGRDAFRALREAYRTLEEISERR